MKQERNYKSRIMSKIVIKAWGCDIIRRYYVYKQAGTAG